MEFVPEKLLMVEWPNVLPSSPHKVGARIISLGKETPELELLELQ